MQTNWLEMMWNEKVEDKAFEINHNTRMDMKVRHSVEMKAMKKSCACKKCNGTGLYVTNTFQTGRVVGSRFGKDCFSCRGTGLTKGGAVAIAELKNSHQAQADLLEMVS